ncbi:unnamed protein product [Nippostrongylus brasiliensis]|uniref:Uncharacterized protein n=1 Tax=Nippostrongylus brasiliensis TaxID=27835 RepID=A0A3P7BQT9_NIPBR|nr:unnamed protein product [Nippostrongylus brasiliensis]
MITIPSEVNDIELDTKTKRVPRHRSKFNNIDCRATTKGDGDTGALGLFYQCPGRQHQKDFAFSCSVGEKMFKDVMPSAVETIGHLRFDTDLGEISSILDRSEALCCVLVGPTSENPFPKKDWCKLSSALASAARNGIKILAVAPPRGDGAYERNRIDMNETLELAKSVAVLAKQNIISYIPAIESAREPSHGPGARPRNSSSEKYSKEVLRDYFESLNTYLKGELDLPPWEEKISRNARTHRYFKERRAIRGIPKASRKFPSFRTQPMAMPVQPHMYPFPFQGQYMMAPTGTYPREFTKSRGRGHFNHRRQDHFNHRFKRGNNSGN